MKKVVIIGGHGNGTVIASTIEDCRQAGQEIECAGFLNDNETSINEYPVLGGIINNDWQKLDNDYYFIYAMSNVKLAYQRYHILKNLSIPIERFITVIHPTAVVSKNASLGKGVVLMPYTVVGPDVVIGNHTNLLAQSFVGHDATLGEMVFVANNASIGGSVNVENGSHIGSNSSVIERITLGNFSVIGLGSVVLKEVERFSVVAGNPAKFIRSLKVERKSNYG